MAKTGNKRATKRSGGSVPRPARRRIRAGLQVSGDVVSRRLGDEVILVNLKTDRVYALNPTAARVWELLAARRSLASIERKLVEEFSVDGSKLSRDVAKLVTTLRAKKLVRAKGR
jgi:coenzyme PQQ synthesis protein D (PqqD)